MLSLCTALCEDAVRNKLLDDAGIRAASLLLDEDASALNQPEKRRIVNGVSEIESRGYYAGGRSRYPQLNFMTDGNYCLITSAVCAYLSGETSNTNLLRFPIVSTE